MIDFICLNFACRGSFSFYWTPKITHEIEYINYEIVFAVEAHWHNPIPKQRMDSFITRLGSLKRANFDQIHFRNDLLWINQHNWIDTQAAFAEVFTLTINNNYMKTVNTGIRKFQFFLNIFHFWNSLIEISLSAAIFL